VTTINYCILTTIYVIKLKFLHAADDPIPCC